VVPSGWQSTSALTPPAAKPQLGSFFVPFNIPQTNTATIDKWQQPFSTPVLSPAVQQGNTFVPFDTLQLNTAPLGWYQALATTPPEPPTQPGSSVLSYNIAPIINTISGMGWFQALASTPPGPPSQIGATFVPFDTAQISIVVSPYGWYQPLSLAPPVAQAIYPETAWIPAPFPTFTLAWQQPLSIAPSVAIVPYTQPILVLSTFPTFTLGWQQPLASTPLPSTAQLGSTSLSYTIQPLANTVVGIPWQQPLSTPLPVAVAYQSQFFVPYNTTQIIVVATLIQRTLTGVGL